ncbi:MAG: AAA family ATPase [Lachnospiraceae bacterium]|nr:AAA family ATPase [Lachnospiraceae bacterium]
MKAVNTSTYTFEKLINGNCIYVDKTEYFYKLVTGKGGMYFMSRPRRFGKSLAVSIFDAIFRGKKDLFRDLKIYDMDYDWEVYPVIRLDFASEVLLTKEQFDQSLKESLKWIAKEYGITEDNGSPAVFFKKLIRSLKKKTGKNVVLLIDEYDKPLLDHLSSPEEAEEWQKYMDSFYQIIKGSEADLRFVFMTGVTKFAKVSVFSKLNNLDDLTMNRDYSEMFGYTQEEVLEYFSKYFDDAVKEGVYDLMHRPLTRDGLIAEIKRWYDGFKFSEDGQNVYNPVSVGQFINNHYRFKNYWFATGTPSFLMEIIKKNGIVDSDLTGLTMQESLFDTFDVTELAGEDIPKDRIYQLLYQTGYLTIDGSVYGPGGVLYTLRYPNHEVKDSFEKHLFLKYTGQDATTFGGRLYMKAMNGETEGMIELLKNYFASFPYDIQIKHEKYYQSMVRIMFEMSGMKFLTEDMTNTGRIDGVLEAGGHLYIIEFKLNKNADEALAQIDEKKYAEKYILPAKEKGLKLHKLGINFCYDKDVRNITEWKEE